MTLCATPSAAERNHDNAFMLVKAGLRAFQDEGPYDPVLFNNLHRLLLAVLHKGANGTLDALHAAANTARHAVFPECTPEHVEKKLTKALRALVKPDVFGAADPDETARAWLFFQELQKALPRGARTGWPNILSGASPTANREDVHA